MISRTTPRFWKYFECLPSDIQDKARDSYQLFRDDPWYPSLNFKRVHSRLPVYSVRITLNYRAVGILKDEKIVWFWIGSHPDYEALLKDLRKSQASPSSG